MMAKNFEEIFESFNSLMKLLRNEDFQYLLENYERAKKVFLVGYEIKDDITSETLFVADGKHDLKPQDYLIAFSEFVKKNEKQIEAIGILLNRPKSWNTKALNELKTKLKENDFEEVNLRKAHKIVYHKDLVDIISMIKHAANQQEPLFSVDERVNIAFLKVLKDKQFTKEQLNWIEYIKEHLKQNYTIDEYDLKEVPIFANHGGWSKYKELFPDNYKDLITEINIAIAA
jgi:type I restriction enzyme, R subunit